MSIKIDGTNNIIKKETGSKVSVVPSLYLNGTEITGSGGGGGGSDPVVSSVSIDECGAYPKSLYATASKVIVQVPDDDWFIVANYDTSKNWYEINSDGEYDVSNLAAYDGIVVTKASEPKPMPEKDDITITFVSASDIVQSSYEKEISFLGTIDYINYDVQITMFEIPISYQFTEGNGPEIFNSGEGNFTLAGRSTNFTGIVSTGTHTIEHQEHVTQITAEITIDNATSAEGTATLKVTRDSTKNPTAESYVNLSFNYDIGSFTIVISQTPKTQSSSTLSLRNTTAISQPTIYENLVVNNDALIQGNLSVNGYINDLSWYWDTIAINTVETDLGVGFLAKITGLTFKLNSEQVLVPTLQLSPGSSYKESSYSIIWSPTGALKIDADDITEISGSIQILRYE